MLFNLSLEPLIGWLNSLQPEWVWVVLLVFCFGSVLGLLRIFGEGGLYVYITVAIIAANIQVLKATQFSLYSEPIALGTVLFTSTYLATDALTEYYGPRAGRRGIYLGFAAMILMTVFMTLGLGFRPLPLGDGQGVFDWAAQNHIHMEALFTPTLTLLVAGMMAYLLSQLYDVWSFNCLKQVTGGRYLWLRNNVSTLIAALIDNTVFCLLAWVVFAKKPLPWEVVVYTYILGTYGLRVIVALLDTPFIYLARYCLPHEDRVRYEELQSRV